VTRTLADVVRVAGALSLVAVTTQGGVALALMALVLLGLTLLRLVGVPPALDLATGTLLVVAAWWALLGSYERHPWLDVVGHLAATGLVAVAAYRGLVAAGAVPAPGDPAVPRGALGAAMTTVCLGLALAGLWEMGEWCGHTFVDAAIRTGYDDTVGDLASGGLGALLAASADQLRSRRSWRSSPRPLRSVSSLSDARGG